MINLFLRWWLHSGRYPWSKFRRRLFERRYLQDELPVVNSLADIVGCLGQVVWTMDGPWHLYDAVSYPEKVWAAKKDDCDGFSVLAAKLLQGLGSDTEPVLLTAMLRPVRRSHTVCGFRNIDGSLGYFDNSTLRQGDFHEYADIVARIKGDNEIVCWDVRKPDTFELIEFHQAGEA